MLNISLNGFGNKFNSVICMPFKKGQNFWLGRKHSEEAKKKIGEARKKITGWKHSEETKQKIGEANSKRIWKDISRKKISEHAKKRIGNLNPFYGKKMKEETKNKIKETKRIRYGYDGIKTNKKGYRFILVAKNRYIAEHRFLMEKYLGRKLKRNEIIHHINENPNDNNLKNLQLVSRSEHNQIHKKKW